MTCADIISFLEEKYPPYTAEEWDNCGLLVGKRDREVKKIVVALDAVDEVIDFAAKEKSDMLITHHPMIFGAVKKINEDSVTGQRIIKLIENGISYYAMHTNFDICAMADINAKQLEIKECDVLTYTGDGIGLGKTGILKEPIRYLEFAEKVKKVFDLDDVRCYGEGNPLIERVAVCSGSGKSLLDDVFISGADVYVTGDIDYHTGIDAFAKGLRIIDAGHFGTEHIFADYVREMLKESFADIDVVKAEQKKPYTLV